MNQVSRTPNPVAELSVFMGKLKSQMTLALPKHMNADRMTRLALTAFSTNPDLQLCTHDSIAGSIMVAAQMGLEPGVNGQGYLIPYKGRCTFVPGWKGIVDIANRSGRSSVWTGAVFQGDEFDYALGDRPFITHKPGKSLGNADDLEYVYAVGRVRDSEWPIIEVWSMEKIWAHRDHYNKVGKRHYSFDNPEMYARKIPLLQVLKYMPSSIELATAIEVSNAADAGKGVVIDGNFVTVTDNEPHSADKELPICSDEAFATKKGGWKQLVVNKAKSVNDLIDTVQTKERLTPEQKMEIASWAQPEGGAQ
jgi:recombination protein RecT